LGRDYIEAGRLIQKTFPAFGVRFIAVTDNFDSLTADKNDTSLVIPVKNFINDSYCRDISQKVKSSQKIKRENGEFIGAFVVYGYRKDKLNKNRLVPDDYAAGIVKSIFLWKIEGMSTTGIADKLNDSGILSPMEYKRIHGENYSTSFATGKRTKWSAVAVKRILTNEIYLGTMVQGREERISYKVKKAVKKPEDEWIRVEATHEAIISKEDFEMVKKLLKVDTRAAQGKERAHIFAGLLYCGDCGELMIRRVNRYKGKEKVYFICQTKHRGEGCSRHGIEEEVLSEIVLQSVKTNVSLYLEKCEQLSYLEQKDICFEEVAMFDKEIALLHKEKEKYLTLLGSLYEDLKEGLITEKDFKNLSNIYEENYQEAEVDLKKQEDMIKELFKSGIAAGVNLEKFKQALSMTEIDRNILMSFIFRINVYEDKKVEITLRFQERLSKLLLLSHFQEDRERLHKQPLSSREVV